MFLDEELANQNQTKTETSEEDVIYEIPKPVSEIGMTYVTMQDFIFDPEQKQAQVV